MLTRLRRAGDLSLAEWAVLVQLIVGAIILRGALRLVSLRTLATRLAVPSPWRGFHALPLGQHRCQSDRLPHLCDLAGGLGFSRGRCLIASLLLYRLLIQRGHDARMCLGVRTSGAAFPAHAWIETDGMPADGTDRTAFATLIRL